mmetsp:Transcript_61603/g.101775  ORF Transcript_61603/g.101775 Transcript_61603/m.101775 type:complete len:243 (+) Transcript_61603:639-1367(+)
MRMPKKKRMPWESMRERAAGAFREAASVSPKWITSVISHIVPKLASIPRYGGSPVHILNTGTNISAMMPDTKNKRLCAAPRPKARDAGMGGSVPANSQSRDIISSGTNSATMLGRISANIVGQVVMLPLIHSIVVVTSPMGVQAPPAFAAMTARPPKSMRSSVWSGSIFRSSETMTMVDVRLSSTAERQKVTTPTMNRRVRRLLVWMFSVMTRKPWCASTISTIVMAPSRKNRISAASESAP